MRRGDNNDKIGIFVQGTISVSSVAQPCFFAIFIKKKERKMKKRKGTQASEVLLLVQTHKIQQQQHLRGAGYDVGEYILKDDYLVIPT